VFQSSRESGSSTQKSDSGRRMSGRERGTEADEPQERGTREESGLSESAPGKEKKEKVFHPTRAEEKQEDITRIGRYKGKRKSEGQRIYLRRNQRKQVEHVRQKKPRKGCSTAHDLGRGNRAQIIHNYPHWENDGALEFPGEPISMRSCGG